MSEIVGGRPRIVFEVVARDAEPPYSRDGCAPHFCAPHPRTASGITQDGGTLILATVDGRYTGANGMTTRQVGDLMVEMGAWSALNMDGGGSTTMYVEAEGGVVNNPSDGSVRTVSNHLGIQIVEPYGDLTGVVRSAEPSDAGEGIAEAEVALSTGETGSTDATGQYSFSHVAAGEVTVTATAPENRAADTAGMANRGKSVGNVGFAPGVIGHAFDFRGGHKYVRVPDHQSLDGFTQATWSFWVNLPDPIGSLMGFMDKRTNSDLNNAYSIFVNDWSQIYEDDFGIELGNAAGGWSNHGAAMDRNSLQVDTWHHVAVTFDMNAFPNYAFYLDGVSCPLSALGNGLSGPVFVPVRTWSLAPSTTVRAEASRVGWIKSRCIIGR